ncbi:hypothetical protein [Maricaulis sp.]|uniref:hypothetical protein n=1 Tax=Maricaulis sp. TaxID=1486257 RepID=UPI0026151891|nr:hypothetical protein [Maricaulis sp.]
MIRALLAAAFLASAGSATAEDVEREAGPLPRLFPHRETYLDLPPDERSRFRLDYVVASQQGVPPEDIRIWYEHEGERIELALTGTGRITNPPDAGALAAEPTVWVNQPGGSMALTMLFAYAGEPATRYERGDLLGGLSQANRAMRRAAGVAALFAPNFKTVIFEFDGPAPEAWAVDEDGSRTALTVQEDRALFRPRDRENRSVSHVEFGREPVRVLFDS